MVRNCDRHRHVDRRDSAPHRIERRSPGSSVRPQRAGSIGSAGSDKSPDTLITGLSRKRFHPSEPRSTTAISSGLFEPMPTRTRPAIPHRSFSQRTTRASTVGTDGSVIRSPKAMAAWNPPESSQASSTRENRAAEPIAGGVPVARAGTLVHRRVVEPGTAAQHTAAAVALHAVLHPLPQIPDHVRQTRGVGTIRADRARAAVPRPPAVASGLGPGRRPFPFRLGRQTIPRSRRPAQPRQIRLRVVPAHTRHRMTIRLWKPGVLPRIA